MTWGGGGGLSPLSLPFSYVSVCLVLQKFTFALLSHIILLKNNPRNNNNNRNKIWKVFAWALGEMLADFILRSTGVKRNEKNNATRHDGCLVKSLHISAHQLKKERKFLWGALMQKLHN